MSKPIPITLLIGSDMFSGRFNEYTLAASFARLDFDAWPPPLPAPTTMDVNLDVKWIHIGSTHRRYIREVRRLLRNQLRWSSIRPHRGKERRTRSRLRLGGVG